MSAPLFVNARVTIPGAELRWVAVRSSGAGGQHVNKVSSKVELRFDVLATRVIDAPVKERLKAISGSKLCLSGELILTSQRTRDQAQNLSDAREKLADLLRRACVESPVRRTTRPSRARVRARLDDKRKQGDKKASRGHAYE